MRSAGVSVQSVSGGSVADHKASRLSLFQVWRAAHPLKNTQEGQYAERQLEKNDKGKTVNYMHLKIETFDKFSFF